MTGTLADVYITGTGETRAFTRRNAVISAFVSDGKNGFVTIDGTIDASGTFTIPGVPAGAYTVGVGTTQPTRHLTSFLVTSERHLDLGREFAMRPDVTTDITSPTNLVVNVTGLSPWQENDELEFFASGAGTWDDLIADLTHDPPVVGTTSLQGFTVDSSAFAVRGLIDGGKGDRAFLTQLATQATAGLTYRSIASVFLPAPFTQRDGTPTALSGAFAAVPQTAATIDWKRSQFQALAHDVHPQATVDTQELFVYAELGGSARSLNSISPTLATATTSESTDISVALRYGNPFPSAWTPIGQAYTTFKVPLAIPGSQAVTTASASTSILRPLSTFAAAAAQPVLSPPRELRVNGESAYENRTGVGGTPVVSWSAPTIGSPAAYIVTVRRIQPNKAYASNVAHIRTNATTVTIPPGVLTPGSFYYLQVAAETGYKPAAPNTYSGEIASAEALTAVLAP